jgi:putative SOS response-associated peptidase YedK
VCGRYVSTTRADALAAQFEVEEIVAEPDRPRWNIAPTDPVPAVAVTKVGVRQLGVLRWGLVPSFVTDAATAARRINARAETVATSPAFRAGFARRRCILPADGFYEWDKDKQPWFIHRTDGAPMAMAGLWESWRGADGRAIRSSAVITTAANRVMFPVHDRMPVVLDGSDYDAWLDPRNDDVDGLLALLRPADETVLSRHPVSTKVNSVRNDGPDLVVPGSADRPVPLKLL